MKNSRLTPRIFFIFNNQKSSCEHIMKQKDEEREGKHADCFNFYLDGAERNKPLSCALF